MGPQRLSLLARGGDLTSPPFFPYASASVSLLSYFRRSGAQAAVELIRLLQERIPADQLALLKAAIDGPEEVDYGEVIRRVVAKLRKKEELFKFTRSRLEEDRYRNLLELPEGRRHTLLRNSSPVLLLLLFRDLIEQSYGKRFSGVEQSLALALLARDVAEVIAASKYLSTPDSEDLLSEAHAYLANARRINSDLRGAERSLRKARTHLANGTGDRALRADYLNLLTALRVAQGRCEVAADLADRELSLRRLLGDEQKLGITLVQRGWISCFIEEPISTTLRYFHTAMPLVRDTRVVLLAGHYLAELLAREGFGFDALETLGSVKSLSFGKEERFQIADQWIKGIACRSLRQLDDAEYFIRQARENLARLDAKLKLAISSLDLACVYAAKGKLSEVKQLAEEAYAIFKAQGLEERALTAVVLLREATEAERVTEGMAVAVANFLARFPYNKALRFEWEGEV